MIFLKQNIPIIAIMLIGVFFLFGCSITEINTAQDELRNTFHFQNDLSKSEDLIENIESVYRSNDQVLYNLERASIYYYSGDWENSIKYFDTAEKEIDRLFGTSVQRTIRAFAVNDGQLEYQGEDYEDILTNIFKALNYIHLNDIEAARVEARRASFKLSSRFDQYDTFIDQIEEEDDSETVNDWEIGKSNVQESVFGHYLTSVLWSAMGSVDSTRIQFERFEDVYLKHYSDHKVIEDLEKIKIPGSFNTLIAATGGRPPTKTSKNVRIPYSTKGDYILIAVPELTTYEQQIVEAEAVVNDSLRVDIHLIENFSYVAKEVYEVRYPIVETRAVVRGLLKVLAEEAAKSEIGSEYGEGAALLAGFLGKVVREATEEADTRSWQTMPGRVYSTVLDLKKGENQIKIKFYDKRGRNVMTQTEVIDIINPDKLYLIDVFFNEKVSS